MIDKEKVVDLSHRILRRGENFPFHSDYIGNRSSKDWYVMSNIFIGSHVGTHVEVPRHHVRNGLDCLHYPLENLVGDMIFLWTGFDRYHRTDRWRDYRYIAEDAMEWLISFHPKAIVGVCETPQPA